jgi:RNA polymerase sigma-70 factor, ECF subfamily
MSTSVKTMEGVQPGPVPHACAHTLESVFRAHAPTVERWVTRFGGPSVDRDDAVQEVFVVVQRRLPSFKADSGTLTTWLYRITQNVVRHHRRRLRWRRFLGGNAEETAGHLPDARLPSDGLEREEARRRLYAALDGLNERHRTALILFEMEERSGEEIAELMGARPTTVFVWLHRARAQLLDQLQAGGPS